MHAYACSQWKYGCALTDPSTLPADTNVNSSWNTTDVTLCCRSCWRQHANSLFLAKNLQLTQKTKARFSRLLRHPAREWRGPILVLALHKSVTYLLRHLPTQYSPGTHKGPILHRTNLIIFPLTLQTIIIVPMMSLQKRNSEDKWNRFLQAAMPFCHQINSVKALTLTTKKWHLIIPCYWLQSEGTPHTVHQLYDAPLRLSYKQQQQQSIKNHFPSLIIVRYLCFCLQCFDTGCWLGSRKGIQPVLAWSSVWSKVQMICIWSSWCHCHSIMSCSSKI